MANVIEHDFKECLGCFPSGVTVVTSTSPSKEPLGVTISSFASLSLDPPLVLFCLDHKARHYADFLASSHFVVHILSESQQDLSTRFSRSTEDKWQNLSYQLNAEDCPILANTVARIECSVENRVEGGDHMIFIGRVNRLNYDSKKTPLLYHQSQYKGVTI